LVFVHDRVLHFAERGNFKLNEVRDVPFTQLDFKKVNPYMDPISKV